MRLSITSSLLVLSIAVILLLFLIILRLNHKLKVSKKAKSSSISSSVDESKVEVSDIFSLNLKRVKFPLSVVIDEAIKSDEKVVLGKTKTRKFVSKIVHKVRPLNSVFSSEQRLISVRNYEISADVGINKEEILAQIEGNNIKKIYFSPSIQPSNYKTLSYQTIVEGIMKEGNSEKIYTDNLTENEKKLIENRVYEKIEEQVLRITKPIMEIQLRDIMRLRYPNILISFEKAPENLQLVKLTDIQQNEKLLITNENELIKG